MIPDMQLEKDISKIFEDVSFDIELILLAAVASGQLRNSNYYNRQRAAIISKLSEAKRKATPLIAKAIKDQYTGGSKKALQWLAAFFGIDMKQPFSPADQRAVELLVQSTLGRLDSALASMGTAAEQTMTQQALQEVANLGVSAGKSEEAARRLEAALVRAGTTLNKTSTSKTQVGTRLIRVNGRNYDAKKYSQLVVKTETNRAYNQGTLERLKANNWDIVSINATAATCNLCSTYDSGTYSLTGADPAYPVLGEYPPYHPGCQHYVEPVYV